MDMNPNKELIDNLTILKIYYKQTGDKWRQTAYERAIFSIKGLDVPITDISQVKNLKGVGKSIREKIKQFIDTGQINKVEEIRELMKEEDKKQDDKKDKQFIIDSFTKIWGIGVIKASQLYKMGFRNIEDIVLHAEVLNDQQKIGIKYYHELLQPISRKFITVFQIAIRYILNKEFGGKNYTMEVAGSYRRGAHESGDIDILISSETFTLLEMVTTLQRWKLITDILSMKDEKFMGIAQCGSGEGPHFRMDIEFVHPDEWYTGLVYFTGSKLLNIQMRADAKRKGYTLNQHGLFVTNTGERIPINSEEELFRKLQFKYLLPERR